MAQLEAVRTWVVSRVESGDTRGPWGAWAHSRYLALVEALTQRGVPRDHALFGGSAILALGVKEIGWSCSGEYNYNAWSLHGVFNGHYVLRPDAGRTTQFRAYPSLAAAAGDVARILSASSRYAPAWRALMGSDVVIGEWYEMIMRAGYGPPTEANLTDYRAVVNLVARRYADYLALRPDIPGVAYAD